MVLVVVGAMVLNMLVYGGGGFCCGGIVRVVVVVVRGGCLRFGWWWCLWWWRWSFLWWFWGGARELLVAVVVLVPIVVFVWLCVDADLILMRPMDEHRAFQRSPADTRVDGNLISRFLLYVLFPSTGVGMSTVPSSPTYKDKTFYWWGLIDS